MNWDAVRRMLRDGMAVGAHSHTHRILGRLPENEQLKELLESREVLSRQAGIAVDTVAYPVGLRTSFTERTKALAKQSGYRAAFSFYGGINRSPLIDRFNILRVGADWQSDQRFQVQTAAAALVGRFWP
jgi:peptidoglycan/xylan/chitin deacetylase (PgdA/CDA1 family)